MVDLPGSPSPEALFRYTVVAGVQALQLQGRSRSAAVREVASRPHPFGTSLRTVSERSLWRWLAAWDAGQLAGLEPAAPQLAGSAALAPELVAYLVKQKQDDPGASVPELLHRAREEGVIHPGDKIDRTTAWRALVRRGARTSRRRAPKGPDTRRFAYRERMQLVMVDYKRFRAGPKRARRAGVYLLDDATRYGLGVRATMDLEQAEDVLRVLAETLRQYGLMSVLYWDLGPGFRADDVAAVLARLDIAPIFGTAGYPEARGKIERFNRSLKARTLRGLCREEVDPSLAALQLRLRHDLFEVYNHRPHEALGGRTPYEVFHDSTRALRPVASESWLQERFTLPEERTVSADHVIKFGGELWEAPRGRARQKIDVHRRLLEGSDALHVIHEGRIVRLQRLDPHFNATSGRARPEPEHSAPAEAPRTASMLRYEHDHLSMLTPEGGYVDPTPTSQPQEDER